MSPTLLEGLVALVAVALAWRVGVQLTPLVLRTLRRAFAQVEQVSQELTALGQPAEKKEEEDANPKAK